MGAKRSSATSRSLAWRMAERTTEQRVEKVGRLNADTPGELNLNLPRRLVKLIVGQPSSRATSLPDRCVSI